MEDRGPDIPARGKPNGFCFQENELYRAFEPVIGSRAVALYCNLTSCVFGYDPKFKFSLRSLAVRADMSRATVARELAVLKRVGMVRVCERGGNAESEGELVDLKKLAESLGGIYSKSAMSLVLPSQTTERLQAEAAILRRELQGRPNRTRSVGAGVSAHATDSERDASGSPERHERLTGETQTGVQQIKENRRQENSLSPTPFHWGELWKSKDVPDERKAERSLKRARDCFCGVMDDMKNHLVNPSGPQLSHLEDGYQDWQRFGFDSLGVVEVIEAQDRVRLMLCASDPAMAQAGLAKYRKTWDASARRWFWCEVVIEWR